MMYHFIAIR